MQRFTIKLFAYTGALCLGWALGAAKCKASQERGLYAEQSTTAFGVKVFRVRDTTNGVVCYVTSASEWRDSAIACVIEGLQ